MIGRDTCSAGISVETRGWIAGGDKKHMEDKVSGIHKKNTKLSPLRQEHTHSHGHGHGGAGSGDVPVRGRASYPRDSHSYGDEVGQEEGRGNLIVCVHPHSRLKVLSK